MTAEFVMKFRSEFQYINENPAIMPNTTITIAAKKERKLDDWNFFEISIRILVTNVSDDWNSSRISLKIPV